MRIDDPIFIRRTEKRGYEIIGDLAGLGRIRRYGRSEEEAKERFFEACNRAGDRAMATCRSARPKGSFFACHGE